jgi:uncharacterized 2Fe-2S/4Fe-4S cluster protein (DUF4445 family)
MSSAVDILVELDNGDGRRIPINDGCRSLLDALDAFGLPLNARCGRRGLCRGCEVILRTGALLVEGNIVTAPATVRACQARLNGLATIQVPSRSRIEHRPQVTETFEITVPYAHQPLFVPSPGFLDTAIAVDVGTTTVVVLLVDLVSGNILSRAGAFNEQIRFGDNVITRIEAARKPGNLASMQGAIVRETIRPLLQHAYERGGRSPERIAGGTIAGNTTMLHLLVGEDPTSLGVAPFKPAFIKRKWISASDIRMAVPGLAPETQFQLLPGIGGYVGADITAGIYATGMIFDRAPSLLVDIGTNGEIVLQNRGKLTACATAAGPAFEGCGLRCGTRAAAGAVSNIRLALNPFRIETQTIGGAPLAQATGLCGSAYVDFLATARRSGLLGPTGRFEARAWQRVPACHRLVVDGERAFVLSGCNGVGALSVSEVDVALLLQAKAAMGTGIEILLKAAGLAAADIGQLYLAGGFGMHVDVAHAIAIGLLPGFRESQVRVVGNTSLAGSLLALLDRNTLEEMEKLSGQVEVLDLNLADNFEDRFIEHLMLP